MCFSILLLKMQVIFIYQLYYFWFEFFFSMVSYIIFIFWSVPQEGFTISFLKILYIPLNLLLLSIFVHIIFVTIIN